MTSALAGAHPQSPSMWSAALWNYIHRSRSIHLESLERFRSILIEHLTVHFLSGTTLAF